MEEGTLAAVLAPEARGFVRRLAETYRFTFQELRTVAQAARDLEMWREEPLAEWWQRAEAGVDRNGRERKKSLLRRLDQHLTTLKRVEKEYASPPLAGPPRRDVRLVESEAPGGIFGRCPAHSEKTVCCRLHTIDAVVGCAFGCSYCTIQTFHGDRAELRADLADRLRELDLDPDRFHHVGTGQASDSLVWGNRGGQLDALFDFATRHPNSLLELKTKSDNIRYLLERRPPANVVCSWSLNTEAVIRNEEHGTASLERRLRAARTVAERGLRVGFHFHPMVSYRGWRGDYGDLAKRLAAEFSAPAVAFVSMGSPTFIRPVVQEIRRRGGETRILQMPMVADPHGKQTYPADLKVELYRHLYGALRPWHDSVFFYLCMETAAIWEAVFGRSYARNEEFEQAFARRAAGYEPPAPGLTAAGRASDRSCP
jgi:spore photoproduct lyase